MARFVPQRIRPFFADVNHDDLLTLAELIESGKITPVIDRTCPLSEIFEAIGHLERGRACGKIVITG
jgi:NADPH:quinone reductase-like Zn-dependent oxidoreductase